MEVSGQIHTHAAITPGKTTHGTHYIGGWVGPSVGLNVMEKRLISCLCQQSNPIQVLLARRLFSIPTELKLTHKETG
jgi:hypothetical protein